jgi:hypothetical protein
LKKAQAQGFIILTSKKKIARWQRGNRIQVILECTEHKTSGVAGTSRYITTKKKKILR